VIFVAPAAHSHELPLSFASERRPDVRQRACSVGKQRGPEERRGLFCSVFLQLHEALTPRILVQWLFDAILGGGSLGLGIVDCRCGQLGGPISGCDCVQARRTA
jgi:hypothetical protein